MDSVTCNCRDNKIIMSNKYPPSGQGIFHCDRGLRNGSAAEVCHTVWEQRKCRVADQELDSVCHLVQEMLAVKGVHSFYNHQGAPWRGPGRAD